MWLIARKISRWLSVGFIGLFGLIDNNWASLGRRACPPPPIHSAAPFCYATRSNFRGAPQRGAPFCKDTLGTSRAAKMFFFFFARDVDACAPQHGCRRQEQTSLSIWTVSVYVQPAQRSQGQPPRHAEGPMCSVTNEKSNIAAHPGLSNC